MFGLHFIKTGIIDEDLGKYFSNIFDKRLTGDYDDFIDYCKEEVIVLKEPAKLLIQTIDDILKNK